MSTDFTPLWDFEDPVGSEERFRAAADRAEGTGRLELRTQQARALGLQGRYGEALALLDAVEAEAHSEAGPADRDFFVIGSWVALERGRVHRSSGADGAVEWFEDAATLAREAGDLPLEIDAVHMQALAEGVPSLAVRLNTRALRLARGSDDPAARRWEASLLNNLGCALVDAGRLDQALTTFEKAVELRERNGQRRESQIARWMVGWTLRLLGRLDEARELQRALRAELEADGEDDPYVDEELALLEGARPS